MDEINIETKFTTELISELIKRVLKKSGYDIELQLNKINVTVNDEKAHLHLDADAEVTEDLIRNILAKKRDSVSVKIEMVVIIGLADTSVLERVNKYVFA